MSIHDEHSIIYSVGKLTLDLDTHEVSVDISKEWITRGKYKIGEPFVEYRGNVVLFTIVCNCPQEPMEEIVRKLKEAAIMWLVNLASSATCSMIVLLK